MFKYNILLTLRNIAKYKGYAFINIFGLAFGLAGTILILLWAQNELSYDKFHNDSEQLYAVCQTQYYSGRDPFKVWVNPAPMAKSLKTDFPEISRASTYSWGQQLQLSYHSPDGKVKAFNQLIRGVENDFLKMFDFTLIEGNADNMFAQPNSIVITKEMAEKYFGDKKAVGKTLVINNNQSQTITGVVENLPSNTWFDFDGLVPMKTIEKYTQDIETWGNNWCFTFIKINSKTNKESINEKIKHYLNEKRDEESTTESWLFPVEDLYLYTIWDNGPIVMVRIFILVAILILIIACINFMNLATARSSIRTKEIALKKVAGAYKRQLVKQFLVEAFVYSSFATILAFIFVEAFLPSFSNIIDKKISIDYTHGLLYLFVICIIIISALMAGSYPAFYLSSVKTHNILKGKIIKDRKGLLFRKILVVFQFTLSIVFIISLFIIQKQIDYLSNLNLGYKKEGVAYIPLRGDLKDKTEMISNELIKNPQIEYTSLSSSTVLNFGSNGGSYDWNGKPENVDPLVTMVSVDHNFLNVMDIKLLEGQFFKKSKPGDTIRNAVINKKFADIIGKDDIVGMPITRGDVEFTIIGVVDNFNFYSGRNKTAPLFMHSIPEYYYVMQIKMKLDNVHSTVKYINKTLQKAVPGFNYNLNFIDEQYDRQFKNESRVKQIFSLFALLAIVISCLGLFGLASFMTEQRTKEIGIRKVNGASTRQIVMLLSSEFSQLVLLAFFIAIPVSYLLLDLWLQNYAYKTNISWEIFALTGVLSLLIALLTVMYQSIRVALKNPVESLRYE